MKILDVILEQFKQLGMYSVSIHYGEDIGCDDMDVKEEEREVKLLGVPVGCLGECRVMYKGTLKSLREFDLQTKPIKISNPPERHEYDDGGYFIWGTDDGVKRVLNKPIFGKWKETK
jgi:hypothetical protein